MRKAGEVSAVRVCGHVPTLRAGSTRQRRRTLVGGAIVIAAAAALCLPPIGASRAEEPPAAEPSTEGAPSEEPSTEETADAATEAPVVESTAPTTDPAFDAPIIDAVADEPTPESVEPFVAASQESVFQRAALGARTVEIGDPYSLSPGSIDLGDVAFGAVVAERITVVNGSPFFRAVDVYGRSDVVVSDVDPSCGDLFPADHARPVYANISFGPGGSCDITVTLEDTATARSVSADLSFDDFISGETDQLLVTAEVLPPGPPANDDFDNAQDISGLAIPAFVDDPDVAGLQPLNTVKVDGTVGSATFEPGEESPVRSGTVWYRYTAPENGFAGRLGYRVPFGFVIEAFTELTSAPPPNSASAPGNDRPLPSVRMEPGHTVWFSVFSLIGFGAGDEFTVELFQVPHEADHIADANGEVGGGNVVEDHGVVGASDTFNLTSDTGGPAESWYTAVFLETKVFTFSAWGVRAAWDWFDPGEVDPFGVTFYRSPTGDLTNDPGSLEQVLDVPGGIVDSSGPGRPFTGSAWVSEFTVTVEPGRYYWSVSEGMDGPTFYGFSTFIRNPVVPPTISIAGPPSAAVGATTTVTVTASHPGDTTAPVPAGFQFNLVVDFSERVLSADRRSSGVSCTARPGESPPREFSCTSSTGLAPGESVSVDFEVSTPANDALSACENLTSQGKRFGAPDDAGPVCSNVVAYPGPYDDAPINRAVVGGDAVMASIPLIGPYLRFTASATDAAPGTAVTLRVSPRNAGTGTLARIAFVVFPEPIATWNGQSPPGWSCQLFDTFYGRVRCTAASTLTLAAGQSTGPLDLRFTAPPVPVPSNCRVTVPAPAPNPCGTFRLDWQGIDSNGFSQSSLAVQTVAYRIGINQAPIAVDNSYSVEQGRVLTVATPGFLANDSDPDGDVLSMSQFVQPPNGVASVSPNGSFTYTPAPGFVGRDSFVVTITDGFLTVQQTVTIDVTNAPPPPPPSGPCVIVDTPDVELGEVALGSSGAAPVTVRSCSDAPISLNVSVSNATRTGSTETWIASTSTSIPLTNGEFSWTIQPPGGAQSPPLGTAPAAVGPALAARAERVDTHRIRLGPSGPGLGSRFTSTITYTATTP